jgi:hypothetical protein
MKTSFAHMASGSRPYAQSNVAHNYDLPYRFATTPVRVDSFAIDDYKAHYKTWPSEGDANIYAANR